MRRQHRSDRSSGTLSRSGSTSILEGLNALPGVQLSGENYALLTNAQEAATIVHHNVAAVHKQRVCSLP